ncbi:MAG: DNA repair protein RecO [Lachnospiraceae bacterium]|nr:DNA repair protein RecO [Lachnospiraceae bacterium]MDD7076519.1 DNA repair protein RecO [Lachnospiraceae bacterium]MDY3730450.1 DNA repair protein RecO [Candidatus Choladocola sp.]
MSEPLKLNGMVLLAVPSGEYDKRTVILTKERGKITAFARGARRQNSTLLAAANPFAFGTFTLYEGRNAYTLVKAEISNYFTEVREDFEAACYGCYFMEVAEYYTRENLDGGAVLNLLYATLRALTKKKPDNELIRCIFEMKAMVVNGEYPYDVVQDTSLLEATRYALGYVIQSPIQKLYTFTLAPEVFQQFRKVQDHFNRQFIDRDFKSLTILKQLL